MQIYLMVMEVMTWNPQSDCFRKPDSPITYMNAIICTMYQGTGKKVSLCVLLKILLLCTLPFAEQTTIVNHISIIAATEEEILSLWLWLFSQGQCLCLVVKQFFDVTSIWGCSWCRNVNNRMCVYIQCNWSGVYIAHICKHETT